MDILLGNELAALKASKALYKECLDAMLESQPEPAKTLIRAYFKRVVELEAIIEKEKEDEPEAQECGNCDAMLLPDEAADHECGGD